MTCKGSGLEYRRATSSDLPACLHVRGQTRDNPLTPDYLASLGVTTESWGPLVDSGQSVGFVAEKKTQLVGFCFADTRSGEVTVLALLPEFEGLGAGRSLLHLTTQILFSSGREEVWLKASPDPQTRAYGFYRHLGWRWSGATDEIGDQVLLLRA